MVYPQRVAFAAGEADAWYDRNAAALVPSRHDPVLRLADAHRLRPDTVLEVGCADGWRLATFRARGTVFGRVPRCVGVELSAHALAAGRARYPALDLREGHAARLPGRDRFDLIVLAFVLHWLDRSDYAALVAALPRRLAPGGAIVVADFFPSRITKVPYRHVPGLWTYKQDYGTAIAKRLGWAVTACRAFDHRRPTMWQAPSRVRDRDRCAAWLLRSL